MAQLERALEDRVTIRHHMSCFIRVIDIGIFSSYFPYSIGSATASFFYRGGNSQGLFLLHLNIDNIKVSCNNEFVRISKVMYVYMLNHDRVAGAVRHQMPSSIYLTHAGIIPSYFPCLTVVQRLVSTEKAVKARELSRYLKGVL